MNSFDEFDTFDDFDSVDEVSVEMVTTPDTEVRLQEVNVAQEINKNISDNLQYPCVIISGIKTTEEVTFFNSRKGDTNKELPLYIDFNGYVKQIGVFEISLNNLLVTRCISDYEIRLYRDAKNYMKIDLHAPEHLIKFITI